MSKNTILPILTQRTGTKSLKKVSIHISQEMPKSILCSFSKDSNRNFLVKSRERIKKGSMESFTSSIGPKAKLDFIDTYKHRLEIADRNTYEKLESSPSAAYLEIIDREKLNPLPFGMVRNSGKETEMDLHGYSMGDNYAKAFSEGLKHCRTLEKINLNSNRLSEKGSLDILQQIEPQNLKELGMSNNKLGIKSITKISQILTGSKSCLKHLSLEGTNLNDSGAIILFDSITNNSSITRLNLARNKITELCCGALKTMLMFNKSLSRMDLHWNQLTGRGTCTIFEGLSDNKSLIELDLSWNLIARNLDLDIITRISDIISNQKSLKHLDLSFNYLTGEDCKVLADGFCNNHEILGVHMIGNDCVVDSSGFLIPNIYVNKLEQGHFASRIIGRKKANNHNTNNCWVCEKWVEIKLYWTGPSPGPVCIHLDCDNYEPDLMIKENNYYTITRVVPPGKLNFFFSVDMCFAKSSDYKVKQVKAIEKEIVFWGDSKVDFCVNSLNQIDVTGNVCLIKEPFGTKPRTPKLVYNTPPTEMEKIPWSISLSLFKDYRTDDESVLNDCFEFDWKHCRIPNLIKDPKDLESTKEYLRSNYRVFRESYKTLSSYSGSEIPCVGSNTFVELLTQSNVFDNLYAISDFGVNWNSSMVPSIKNQLYNPGSSLVRYEYLEIITRVAYDRYIRTKSTNALYEAIQSLMTDHLLPKLQSLCTDKWRTEYLTETTDVTLKCHKPIFDALYKKYSGKKALPGQKPFMSLEEFRDLCNSSGLVNDSFSTREIDTCFTVSMMTQVDELYKKKHTEMSYVEFLEAICRACDISYSQDSNLQSGKITLQNKIENAANLLLKLCPSYLQENFVFPNAKNYEKLMFRPKGKKD